MKFPRPSFVSQRSDVEFGSIPQRRSLLGVNPGYAEFGTDIRTVPGMSKSDVERDPESFLDVCRKDDPSLRVELEFAPPPLDWIVPTEVNSDLPIAGALAASQK